MIEERNTVRACDMKSLEAREAPLFRRAPGEVHPDERPTSDGLVIGFGDEECPGGAKKGVTDSRRRDGDACCSLCDQTLCPGRVCEMTDLNDSHENSEYRETQT